MQGFVNNQECGRYGGLSRLRLAAAQDVLAAKYDKTSGCFAELVLATGASMACYEFEEDTALYRQTVEGEYPYEKVVHDISFSLPYFGSSSSDALAELLAGNPGGFVALVTTTTEETYLVGWSLECEEEAPLRVVSAKADSRAEYAGDSFCVVELRSEDISFAKLFSGTLD